MNRTPHLCPCCAAHLRVPSALQVMRCGNCEAELVFINEGGVRGLAQLPDIAHCVPYSDPRQRTGLPGFDARELLESRRALVQMDAQRRQSFWTGLFLGCLLLVVGAGGAAVLGLSELMEGRRETIEPAALTFLGSALLMPLLTFVAVHFQGRARMYGEQLKRWRV